MNIWRSKFFWFIAVLVFVACALMVLCWVFGKPTPIGGVLGAVVTPIEDGLSGAAKGIENFLGYFYRYNALVEENERLQTQVDDYQAKEQEYYEAVNENVALRDLASLLTKHKDFICEPGEVISYSSGAMSSGFTINRGSLYGIKQGDAVITKEGLVGYVSEVGVNYSQVVEIIDRIAKVACVVSRTRETVVAEGNFELSGEGLLRLSYLKNGTDIQKGDLVETSGYGGMYPKGLAVGRVREVLPESHGISSYAVVEPTVDLSSLTYVFVVKDYTIVE